MPHLFDYEPVFQVFSNLQLTKPNEERPFVESALLQYVRRERLALDDVCQFEVGDHTHLRKCGARGCRSTKDSVIRWPLVLTLGIRRTDASSQKIFKHISFEVTLSVTDDTTYNLRGVVVHHGDSVTVGHYTAYVCGLDGKWFHCNDDMQPRHVEMAEVISAQAYLLFYEKR